MFAQMFVHPPECFGTPLFEQRFGIWIQFAFPSLVSMDQVQGVGGGNQEIIPIRCDLRLILLGQFPVSPFDQISNPFIFLLT
ncbi:MAG: hypothetical protein JJU29_08865 [Verrucomicrobia bacterium]|nr:hypothetical protein [Verrucomicrobiota bacterium]